MLRYRCVPRRPGTDTEGFEEFYDAAFGRLVGRLFLITGDLHEAEEVVQEAFTRAAARWRRLRAYDAPETWVRRVAINLANDGFRRARFRLAALPRLAQQTPAQLESVDRLALSDALAALPRHLREAVVLHHLLDLPVEQVAEQTGVPAGTVKSRLARARQLLAARLRDAPDELEVAHG